MNKRIRTGLLGAAMVGGGLVGATQLVGNAGALSNASPQVFVESFHDGDTPSDTTTDDTTTDDTTTDAGGQGREECGGGDRGGRGLENAAETIGIEQSELREGVQSGLTIAQIAEQNGVSAQSVIDAMVAEQAEHVAAEVEAGEITDDEAADWLTQGAERIATDVNEGRPDHPDRPDGRGAEGN